MSIVTQALINQISAYNRWLVKDEVWIAIYYYTFQIAIWPVNYVYVHLPLKYIKIQEQILIYCIFPVIRQDS